MSVNHLKHEQIKTREEYRKIKEETKQKEEVTRPAEKRIRIRLFPIWLRVILLVVLVVASTAAGAAVGYGVIGNGKVSDVFKESTWLHIRDLVEKEK